MIILCPSMSLVTCSKVDFDHKMIVIPLKNTLYLLRSLLDTLQSHVSTPLSKVKYIYQKHLSIAPSIETNAIIFLHNTCLLLLGKTSKN